jgi:peptidoglycan/xylan/chitin deacetylase (PgdA/CDA1 family)
MKEPGYARYVMGRICATGMRLATRMGSTLLRFAQASSVSYQSPTEMSLDDLAVRCRERNWSFHLTTDIHGVDSLDFVRKLSPDLGVVLGTRILKPALYAIPRLGSINIHKRKVPDYRGGGPIGLWEMLDGQTEIGMTVHRVAEKVDTGAVIRATTIRIDTYDTLASLALKADLEGEELLVAAVRGFVEKNAEEMPQKAGGRVFKSPKPYELRRLEKQLASQRQRYEAPRGRPVWKLLLRSMLYVLWLPLRNWRWRLAGTFPVVILYHHLISDRAHPMGTPTEVFLAHLRYLKRHYRIVSLKEATRLLQEGKVKQPTLVLTFDDGYAENFQNLRAVLRAEPTPVAHFVCSAMIAEGRPFPHDERENLIGFAPLSLSQLRQLRAEGQEVASHTRTHFDCGSQDLAQLQREVAGSRAELEKLLGERVAFFSFPWGKPRNVSSAALELAAKTYVWYCSAFGGWNLPGNGERHLRRHPYPQNLWELELTIQGVLERNVRTTLGGLPAQPPGDRQERNQ